MHVLNVVDHLSVGNFGAFIFFYCLLAFVEVWQCIHTQSVCLCVLQHHTTCDCIPADTCVCVRT